jgi:hypothetical protein
MSRILELKSKFLSRQESNKINPVPLKVFSLLGGVTNFFTAVSKGLTKGCVCLLTCDNPFSLGTPGINQKKCRKFGVT